MTPCTVYVLCIIYNSLIIFLETSGHFCSLSFELFRTVKGCLISKTDDSFGVHPSMANDNSFPPLIIKDYA